jgi:mannose-6-phosphate isomerase-like protein (cupin superfamily)
MEIISVPAHLNENDGKATIVAPGQGKSLNVFGIGVDVLLTGSNTNGLFSSYMVHAEPGFAPPPHVHRNEDETFYVLEGEFEVMCGDETMIVSTGTLVSLPRHVAHSFRNVGSKTGHLLGFSTPAGHDKFFEDASQLSFPPNPAEVAAVCLRHGMEVQPPSSDSLQ